MSAESSKRSNLVDTTYSQLHSILCGHLEGVTLDQLINYLLPRKSQLADIKNPFGQPSDASRKLVESGTVKLPDGVVLRVEDTEKDFVKAISNKFQIDQVQALILLRSFLYNEGLPAITESTSTMIQELLQSINPFYYTEVLSARRILIPLFRAKENTEDPLCAVAGDFLPAVIQDGEKYADTLLTEYLGKTTASVPQPISGDPKEASRWAKHNLKEELVLLEVLFWVMWGFAPCSSRLVERIFKMLYETNLGSLQASSPLVQDEESIQLQEDCNALWILISVEVLELETLGNEVIEISDNPTNRDVYTSSPDTLKRLHELVVANNDSQFACTYLAWTYVLARLTHAANQAKEVPAAYRSFLDSVQLKNIRTYPKEPVYVLMGKACLGPDVGLFNLVMNLMTKSPLFVTSAAWKTGSAVADPNAIAFRSVLKGLLIALVELVPVELIPDYDGLIHVWEALFGRSEPQSIAGICAQYWQFDWQHGTSRRAIFDVARSRFPTHTRPLIRLLRAMSGSGFLDTDPISVTNHGREGEPLSEERDLCARHVYYFLQQLPTYTQVIPTHACTGVHALYERQPERFTAGGSSGLLYVNLKPIRLPGGSTLPARSQGRLLSGDGGDYIIVCWQHQHSGWKLLLEILTHHVNRKRSGGVYQDVSFGRHEASQIKTYRLEDIGMEIEPDEEDVLITEILDLIRSLIQENPSQAQQLMEALEEGDPVVSHTMVETQVPDLVQLTTMILEDALTRSGPHVRTPPKTALITSAMSVLSTLLMLPGYASRVWLYVRSTAALFASERAGGFAVALAAERAMGHYTMTLALLHLVQQLFKEASSLILPDNPRLLQVKEEVLLRAARFVHTEIWVEYLSWRYTQLGDRFEIGRRVISFYVAVLEHASPIVPERPFPNLSQAIADALLFKATTSAITPLVSSVNSGTYLLRSLFSARRFGDARRLTSLLESHLRLMRLILTFKQQSSAASKSCLLEQALCARVTGGATPQDTSKAKLDPVDVLATYARERDVGIAVPVKAMHLLYALCSSLSTTQPSPPTIVGHLANPEQTVLSLVKIVQHPYDDLKLRIAVWNFISLAVDREPALSTLFVTGQFRTPTNPKPWEKEEKKPESGAADKSKPVSATDIARDILTQWKSLWESNPQLLACVFRFLNAVWRHAMEHKAVLTNIGQDEEFWARVVGVASEEIGPVPEYGTDTYTASDGIRRSTLHEAIAMHCYRITAKAHAINILGLDIGAHSKANGKADALKKPTSFAKFEAKFASEEDMMELLSEAAPNSYDPVLYDKLAQNLKENCKGLLLEQVRSQVLPEEREFGDDFTFSTTLLRDRLRAYQQDGDAMEDRTDVVEKLIMSINLNLSLTHAQTSLAEAWQTFLRQVRPFMQGKPNVRSNLLAIGAAISYDIAGEHRGGEMMAMIHGTRLSLLLAVLELAWFSNSESKRETQAFIELVNNVQRILQNESQPPEKSFIGALSTPFHRTLLQVVYFCARQARNLLRAPKALNADQRLRTFSMVEASLNVVIDALRINLLAARSRVDIELDRDMELLVAVFEQCIRKDINSSPNLWLARCQEADIIKTSLELYSHTDLVGLTDLSLLLARKQPIYAPHLLLFHMALVRHPAAASRLASQGILTAYSNNFISAAISSGMIDVTLPELPNERSPAHRAYCSMVSIVASVITGLGHERYYFESETSAFIQLYGDQISRTLSWTIGDPITFPLIEEMEQVVNLFHALSSTTQPDCALSKVLRTFSEHALHLLQQISYAVTHPNHLASLLEPVTMEEKTQIEKEGAIADPLKRPLIADLVHRFYRLSSNVIGALVLVSKAEMVLLSTPEDWPVQEALVVPHSKVVPNEPASIGTLLELGNATIAVLRELVGRPAGQTLTITAATPTTSSVSSDLTLDVRQGVITARRNLEGILVYAVTQLAMWLSKPEFDAGGDVDMDDGHAADNSISRPTSRVVSINTSTTERASTVGPGDREKEWEKNGRSHGHGRSRALSLADRLRRGMTGEMTADLQALLNKAKTVFASSESVIGKGVVDITPILLNFLQDRIVNAS